MSAEEFDKTVQLGAAVSKLDESIQQLDEIVEEYGEVAENYEEGNAGKDEVQETVNQVIEDFDEVFDDQDWLGEVTAEIISKEIEGQYQKFIGYQGMVRAAGEIKDKDKESGMRRPALRDSPVREEADEIIDTWKRFLQTYSDAVKAEGDLRGLSAGEGLEEDVLNPYAFETAFMELEDRYDRVSDLNEFVEGSYR